MKRTPLRRRSARTRRIYKARAELVAALLENKPWCEIQWDERCQQRSTDVHEPRTRARHCVDITDEDECITGCRYCHDQVHGNPADAERRGFLVPSGPVVKPWLAAS